MGVEFLEVRLYEALWSVRGLRHRDRDDIVDVCASIVTECEELEIEHRGRAVRSAVQLMIGEMLPTLDPVIRDDLARLCEVEVVSRT
jgi:hypothetical protein